MTKEEDIRLKKLETRIRQLILTYQETEAEKERLLEVVSQLEGNIAEQKKEYQQLMAKYENLKTVKIMEVSSDDAKAIRKRLSKLIRDVDQSIAMLNVMDEKENEEEA